MSVNIPEIDVRKKCLEGQDIEKTQKGCESVNHLQLFFHCGAKLVVLNYVLRLS